HAYLTEKRAEYQIIALYKLLGISVLVGTSILSATFMYIDSPHNAFAIIPISSTIFLLVTFYGAGAYSHKSDPRRLVPGTREFELDKKIKEAVYRYSIGEISHHQMMDLVEKTAVAYKYKTARRNTSKTARSMGLPRSSLYSIMNRHGLKVSDTGRGSKSDQF
ncbi:MAG: hypothetical protein AAF197_08215, partial [Pseudomonadota bacterium]